MPGNGHKPDCQCHICVPGRSHGTRGRYAQGCRCSACVDVNRQHSLKVWHNMTHDKRRKRVRAMKAYYHSKRQNVRHGTTTGYRNGCRCWDCLEAMNIYQRVRNGGTAPKQPGKFKVIKSTSGGNLK